MQRLVYLLFVIATACLIVGCEQQERIQPSGKIVKIGFIGPFTGADGAQGKESVKGARTVLDMQPMLHNGDAIELIIENDDNDPELTERALQKLSQEDKVSAVLIASSSNAVLKVADFVDASEMPAIALLATHPGVVENRKYINQLCFDDKFQGSVAALFVADELLIEKVAVFTEPDNIYSIFLGAEFARKYETVDGVITDTILLDRERNDFDKILTSIREKGAKLLYLPVSAKYAIEIIKAAKNADWRPAMMASDGLLASVLNNHPDEVEQLEGIYATEFFGQLGDVDRKLFHFKARRTYGSLFDGPPSSYTALGVEGFGILYAAMDRCEDSTDRECISQMIRKTKKFEGLGANISIGSDGKAVRPLFINRIYNGELESVVKVY